MALFPRSIAKATLGALAVLALFGASVASHAARADEPSPAAVALATKLLDKVGLKATVDGVLPYMFAELERNIANSHPEMKTALHESIEIITPEFAKTEAGVLDDVARVMASKMSEDDLNQSMTFFESRAGQNYLAAQVPMLTELNVSGTAWRQKMATDVLPRLREEMKKKGFDF